MGQQKLLRMIKWCKMAQLCCYTLNQSDGNRSVSRISNDTAGKVQQCGPKPCYCSNQSGGIFKCQAQLGFLLRWTEIECLNY